MRKFSFLIAFLLFIGMQAVRAQEVSGTVTDAGDGTKLPGVSVIVQGTTVGTVTDIDGKYVLQVPGGYNVLIFSFVGMKTEEVKIDGRSSIDVAMDQDILGLDEVVVTAIGISRETKALGYSVQEVAGDDLTRNQNANVLNSISGRVAGVQVTSSSGTAGGSSFIQIRGAASILGDNQPLFVVDGVPIDNSRGPDNTGFQDDVAGVDRDNRAIDINPEDIASISVLKGGAATALYGLRAANGAIVITTKKGKATPGKKIAANFSQSFGWDKISMVPEKQNVYGQGSGYRWSSGNASTWGPLLDSMRYSKNPDVWSTWKDYDIYGSLVGPSSPYYEGAEGPAQTFDSYDFFQTGFTSNSAISFTGGSDYGSFYASSSYMNQDGVVPNNKFKKLTFLISGDAKVSKRISVSGSANYIESGGDRIQQGSNTSGVMLGLLRTPPDFDNANGLDPDDATTAWKLPDGRQRNYRHGGGYDNPYWTANENKYTDKVKRVIGNVAINYLPTDWISITWRVGTDMYSRAVKDYFAVGSRTQPAGQAYVYQYQKRDFNSDLLINFRRNLTEDLIGNLTVGHNMTSLYGTYVDATAVGMELAGFFNLSNTSSISATENTDRIRRAGLFFDLGFEWKDMLFLNVTGRNDWSTTLPEGNNSFFYPSFGAGFVFTELPGLKDNRILGFGKLRGSYAVVALDAEAYNTQTYFVKAFPTDGWVQPNGLIFPLLGKAGYTLDGRKGNDLLEPERTKTWEVGVDLKFFSNRLGVDFGYFQSKGEKLLLPVPIASSTGFTELYLNAAKMTNKGFEIVAYGTPVKSSPFTWDITFNFSKIDNTVDQLAEGIDDVFLGGFTDPQIRAVAGEPYRSIYGYDWYRDEAGNVLIDASSGLPVGDYERLVPMGKVDPDYLIGITNTFTIMKSISLSFLLDIKGGGLMWNGTKGAMYYFGVHGDQNDRTTEHVMDGVYGYVDGDGNVVYTDADGNTVEAPVANATGVPFDQDWHQFGEGSGFTGPTIQFLEESNWVRLRELTLSYTFGSKVIGTNGFFKALSVYFTGRNLWLSTPYTGIDPETNLLGASNAQGMDYFNMPGTKSYIVGLKASF